MKTYRFQKSATAFLVVMLFVLFFPLLNVFTEPTSVLYGDYKPIVVELSELYVKSGLFVFALIAIPFLLIALVWLVKLRRLSHRGALSILLLPFLAAIVIQYFIAAQMDKYLRLSGQGFPIPWQTVFQSSLLLETLCLILIYVAACAVLYVLVTAVWVRSSKSSRNES